MLAAGTWGGSAVGASAPFFSCGTRPRAAAEHPPSLRPAAFAARAAFAALAVVGPGRGRPRNTHLRSGLRPSLRAPRSRRLQLWDPAAGGRGTPTFAQACGLRCARRVRGACSCGTRPRAVAEHPPSLRPAAFAARAAFAALAVVGPGRGRPRNTHLRSGLRPSLRAPRSRRLRLWDLAAGGRFWDPAAGGPRSRRLQGARLGFGTRAEVFGQALQDVLQAPLERPPDEPPRAGNERAKADAPDKARSCVARLELHLPDVVADR